MESYRMPSIKQPARNKREMNNRTSNFCFFFKQLLYVSLTFSKLTAGPKGRGFYTKTAWKALELGHSLQFI